MKLIVCVDNHMGMGFNHRRQSMDRVMRERIIRRVGETPLWMTPYSAKQFVEDTACLKIDERCQDVAGEGEYCFVEDKITVGLEQVEELILYHWGRDYPADLYFTLPMGCFCLVELTDFAGYSHPDMTEEVYRP